MSREPSEALTAEHEVLPKQDQITPNGYSNFVKAPLGVHQVNKSWCLFIGDGIGVESANGFGLAMTSRWETLHLRTPSTPVSSRAGNQLCLGLNIMMAIPTRATNDPRRSHLVGRMPSTSQSQRTAVKI